MRAFWKTAKHYWQVHVIVALCTAVATGVLAGALIVGDSMRGSLRNITLERLGNIQHALIADHFFSPDIVNRQEMVPAILLNGTVSAAETDSRASKVNIYGVESKFFDFWEQTPTPKLEKNINQPFANIVINEALQNELNVQVGASLLVKFPKSAEIHPEFLLGTKDSDEIIESLRVIVSEIIPTEHAGRFGLRPNQSLPLNAYVSLPVLQKVLAQTGKINALLTSASEPIRSEELSLTLDVLGLKIRTNDNHFDLQSQQYLIDPTLSETALTVASDNGIPTLPTLTYLANSIFLDGSIENTQQVPYSTILALPFNDGELKTPFEKYSSEAEQVEHSDIFLNQWAADDLKAQVNDRIVMTYFNVNAEEEYIETKAKFVLKGIVPIEGIAADTDLIPTFPGIHDTTDLSDWDPPFPFDYSRVRDKDESYWDEYKSTPKAFISLDVGKHLWRNRFGELTSIRFDTAPNLDIEATKSLFETEFIKKLQPQQIGFQFLSLREDGLNASAGSTDFGMLFSGLSFFIIISAATLVGAVFAIGVTQRSREIGILQAVGYRISKIRRQFLFEGVLIACIGTMMGCLLAIGYAQLMIFGLKTWWLPAIGTPFIDLYVSGWSLIIGVVITLIVVTYFIRNAVRRLAKTATAELLSGGNVFGEVPRRYNRQKIQSKVNRIVSIVLGSVFGAIAGHFFFTDGWGGLIFGVIFFALVYFILRSKLGSFLTDRLSPTSTIHQNDALKDMKYVYVSPLVILGFGIGVLVGYLGTILVLSLDGTPLYDAIENIQNIVNYPITRLLVSAFSILSVGWFLFDRWLGSQRVPKRLNRLRFGLKNAAWQPINSKSSVIIMSLACCIIVAVGVNRHDALPETEYAFVAESSLPLHHSLNTQEGRFELGFSEEDSTLLAQSEIYPFRVLPGEDVSCLNLYKPENPQILGAPDSMLNESPWTYLGRKNPTQNRLNAIGDENSLQWILHHDPKDDFIIDDEFGNSVVLQLQTVKNSLFQSQLIISEEDFKEYFPSQSGYQFFLIKTPSELLSKTKQTLERTLEDYGFDVTSASERLANFRAVENTYISTFQSLGGLGVLLGTVGLALVMLRNIIERRRELATLRAFGFRHRLLFRFLFLESGFILTIGMLIGIAAGVVSVISSQGHLPSFPWVSLTITLLLIFVFGIIANCIAVLVALKSPLLSTLKSE